MMTSSHENLPTRYRLIESQLFSSRLFRYFFHFGFSDVLGLVWRRSEAATLFTFAELLLLRNNWLALLATDGDVCDVFFFTMPRHVITLFRLNSSNSR
jgi:hypothetical protein